MATLLTALCLAALFAASRRGVAVPAGDGDATRRFYRNQLAGIDEDIALGRISDAEAVAARGELAREVMRLDRERKTQSASGRGRIVVLAVLPLIVVASFGVYFWIGRSDLPALPLAGREMPAEPAIASLDDAVAQVEARLVETPNDIRGWQALAPVYMQMGRYSEAANAFRRILTLEAPTADGETDLAEALIMINGGMVTDEAVALLQSASARDPLHVRSRFYLAGEMTRAGLFDEAVPIWQHLLSIASGEEPWVATARAGLAAAEAGATGAALARPEPEGGDTDAMIRGMVEGLAVRLYDNGGSAEEWMQLVRSRLVLDGPDAARDDLERALSAVSGADRDALLAYGAELGLDTE